MGILPNGVEAALGILVLIIVVTLGYFCDGRMRRPQANPNSLNLMRSKPFVRILYKSDAQFYMKFLHSQDVFMFWFW